MRGDGARRRVLRLGMCFAALLSTVFAVPLRGQQPPDDLGRLMQLAATGTAKEGSRSAADWAAHCRAQIQSVRSYRSVLIKRDFMMPHLAPRGFDYVEWRLEAAGDHLHVQQVIHEQPPLGELREERIAIGAEHFVGGSAWVKADAQSAADYAELNRFLLLDKVGELLRASKFNLLGVVAFDGRRYALLETDAPRLAGYPMLSEFEEAKGRARVWIDVETGLPAKLEMEFKGKDSANSPLNKGFVQVFAGYNEPLNIAPPAVQKR